MEAIRPVSQERFHERDVDEIGDVPLPQVVVDTVEVAHIISQERI